MANIHPIKDKNGAVNSYQIRIYRGRDAEGKQLKPYSTVWRVPEGMKNKRSIMKEVNSFAAIYEAECKAGLVVTEHKTFQDYGKYVMTLKERDLKHSTVARYKELLDRINPEIGFLKLTDINSEHLNRFYLKLAQPGENKRTGGGLSAKTILEFHHLISAILSQARKEGLVRFNVAETATPPSVKRKEATFFELDEVQKIAECLRQEPLKWQCITQLLIASGARRGEIMGLKWSAINFKKDEIKISSNLLYSADCGTYADTPKTGKTRYVMIDHSVMQLLKQHQKEQTLLRFKLGDQWTNTGYVFTQGNGKPMHPDSITDYLKKFSKKYDLPHVNPHKFRHTQASILYSQGVDPVTISKRLGHDQVSTTQNIYAHLVSRADAEASKAVASALYGNTEYDNKQKKA